MDKRNENDEIDDTNNLTFIANKGIVDEYGNFEIQYSQSGFRLLTEKNNNSSCGSCPGDCH